MKTRPNLLLAIVFVLVLVLAGATALISADRAEPEFNLETPEGVAQAYAVAVLQGNQAEVQRFLDPERKCKWDLEDLYVGDSEAAQLRLEGVEVSGDSATVALLIDQTSGLYDTWTLSESVSLQQQDGTWLVSDQSWPYYGCE